ncbi:MAG: DUF58 domain-containing protein [Planctomycetes bacterium]|nr:DUF58 domain-containing protein [Planctomycetota bacterium]
MIPTARTFRLGLIPLALILLGQGAPVSVGMAWTVVAAVLTGFVFDAWLAWRRPRLRLQRRTPSQLHVDQPQCIRWDVENRSAFPVAIRLRDVRPAHTHADPPELTATVPAQSRSVLSYQCTPTRRGTVQFGDAVYRVRGPLGLAWIQRVQPARQPVRVLPHLANWKAAELAERRALVRQSGSHRYRWRGSGTLFESLREYSPEDDIRWVDWKATARMQRPISRNYEVERHQQVMLLVDASRMMSTYCGERTKFDAVLEAAVLAMRAVVDQGDSAGLLIFSDQVDAYLHPRRERAQLQTAMDLLYDRHPKLVEPDFESALTLTAVRLHRRSLIIVFTDVTVLEAAQRMAAYLKRLTPRHLPLVATISDDVVTELELTEPQTAEQLYQVAVANELMHQREELLHQLRSAGIEVIDTRSDQIATETIERYFELKRRLRL